MKYLTDLFTGTDSAIFDAILSLAVVLLLIMLIAWLVKYFTSPRTKRGKPYRQRLKVNETIAIDAKRKLILVRRDDREHLIMTGGAQDLVIERNIMPPGHIVPNQTPVPANSNPENKPESEGDGHPNLRPGTIAAPLAQAYFEDDPQFINAGNHPSAGHDPKSVLSRGLLTRQHDANEDAPLIREISENARLRAELAQKESELNQLQRVQYHPGMREDDRVGATPAAQSSKRARTIGKMFAKNKPLGQKSKPVTVKGAPSKKPVGTEEP